MSRYVRTCNLETMLLLDMFINVTSKLTRFRTPSVSLSLYVVPFYFYRRGEIGVKEKN